MQTLEFSVSLRTILALLTLALLAAALQATAQEKVLLSFNGTSDGGRPHVRSFSTRQEIFFDAAGNLYGTTPNRGANGAGTAFRLSRDGHGGWTESVLFSFSIAGVNGAFPALVCCWMPPEISMARRIKEETPTWGRFTS